jgi:hypothetical protein
MAHNRKRTLGWMNWPQPIDAKIVWLRASGKRWKAVCWKVGLARAAAHEHGVYALCMIVSTKWMHLPSNRSRRYVINKLREAGQGVNS